MSLRSSAKTIGAIVGNDMLKKAEALVKELCVKPRLREDARQEAVLALLEGRDPEVAIRKHVDDDRCLGLTGGGTRPTVERVTPKQMDELLEAGVVLIGEDIYPSEATQEQTDAAERKLEVAGTVLVKLSRTHRKMLILTTMGWSFEEIAAHMGVRADTVSKVIRRIRKSSREALLRAAS